MSKRRRMQIGIAALIVALGGGTVLFRKPLFGVKTIEAGTKALDLTAGVGMPDEGYADVLKRFVKDDRVDYTGLAAEPSALRSFAATLAVTGPRTTPGRFPTRESRLAYYVNAYNALVLLAVIEHWPIASVHEVRGLINPVPGFGFFWGQRFRLDGDKWHLYGLENSLIRKEFDDARIHAAINCASASCPALASAMYRPKTLDQQLDAAARLFTNDPHVRIVDDRRVIELSMIYKWFEADFVRDAKRDGGDSAAGVLDWVGQHTTPQTRERLDAARQAGYAVEHVEYDWALNGK